MSHRLRLIVILHLAATALNAQSHPWTAGRRSAGDSLFSPAVPGQPTSFETVRQGFSLKLYLDAGGGQGYFVIGWNRLGNYDTPGLEYPVGSSNELLAQAGLHVGAIVDTGKPGRMKTVKLVTNTSFRYWFGGDDSWIETRPADTLRQWFRTSINEMGVPNKRFIDDDADGRIDEDDLDGEDNDADGFVDEDYGAVSEQDYYCAYTDTIRYGAPREDYYAHTPLGIKVWQKSYAWEKKLTAPILPIDYKLINIGSKTLRDVYVALWLLPNLSNSADSGTWRSDYGRFWPDLRTHVVQNGLRSLSPLGVVILDSPFPLDQKPYHVRWWIGDTLIYFDKQLYDLLSGDFFSEPPDLFSVDQEPKGEQYISSRLIFGPLKEWLPGDTLKFSFAYVSGHDAAYSPKSLEENVRLAHTLYQRKYIPPVTLPSPKLTLTPEFQRVILQWDWNGNTVNPLEVWDEAAQLEDVYPPDHWRRSNPPPGVPKGGRIFEGFRLYRSESPTASSESFTLLKQWDVIDAVGPQVEYDVGLDSVFVDNFLKVNKTYWYSVTSFGLPDLRSINYVARDGLVRQTALFSKGLESSVLASRKRINLPFSVSEQLGEVLVVPNPYRTDADYTLESGGWEGRSRSWNENKRLLKFIHLPEKCTIRIFSLSGDVIATLEHENDTRGEMSWNMLSESGRTIASGIYVYTVESKHGTQRGKFVVIR